MTDPSKCPGCGNGFATATGEAVPCSACSQPRAQSSIRYTAGHKYRLEADFVTQLDIRGYAVPHDLFTLSVHGWLHVYAGYAWDGPSGPTIDTRNAMRASLVHDVGYQMIRLGLLPRDTRLQWDDELKRLCLEDGMSRFRAWYWHRAVGHAGEAAHPDSVRKVYTAP